MWRCDKCGEENKDDRVTCWKCWIRKDTGIAHEADRASKANDESGSEPSLGSTPSRVANDQQQAQKTTRPTGFDQSKPSTKSGAKTIGVILFVVGISMLLFGVALIIISPSLIYEDPYGMRMITRNKDAAMYGGVFLLIFGGILSALGGILSIAGFSQSTQPQGTARQSESEEMMKICPECAESIKAAAKVCRFCGHKFS